MGAHRLIARIKERKEQRNRPKWKHSPEGLMWTLEAGRIRATIYRDKNYNPYFDCEYLWVVVDGRGPIGSVIARGEDDRLKTAKKQAEKAFLEYLRKLERHKGAA